MILATSDFEEGINSIDQGKYSDLSTYLGATKEEAYIKRIFGTTLGTEFITDLTGSPSRPQTTKWTTIFNEFVFDYNGYSHACSGLYEILKFLFYNDIVSQQATTNQAGGNSGLSVEASVQGGIIGKDTVLYNRAVENICTLQIYLIDNSDTYTNYQGQNFELQSGL